MGKRKVIKANNQNNSSSPSKLMGGLSLQGRSEVLGTISPNRPKLADRFSSCEKKSPHLEKLVTNSSKSESDEEWKEDENKEFEKSDEFRQSLSSFESLIINDYYKDCSSQMSQCLKTFSKTTKPLALLLEHNYDILKVESLNEENSHLIEINSDMANILKGVDLKRYNTIKSAINQNEFSFNIGSLIFFFNLRLSYRKSSSKCVG